jgi:alpha-L-arabinofuranosidase
MREGKHWSVVVINRSLDKTIATELSLPFTDASTITRHWLTGSAKDRNEREMRVDWEQDALESSALVEGKLNLVCGPASLQIIEVTQDY